MRSSQALPSGSLVGSVIVGASMVPPIVVDDAIPEPARLAAALRPALAQHPVPQSDARTRGLLREIADDAARATLAAELPALAEVVRRVGDPRPPLLVLAVNETPPTDVDTFLLRPHVDRRHHAGRFAGAAPLRTTVVFLDFPGDGRGGELVVFDPARGRALANVRREDARATVARAGGAVIEPRPGRLCSLDGRAAHAVLGYEAPCAGPWRLVVVVAEFGALTSS